MLSNFSKGTIQTKLNTRGKHAVIAELLVKASIHTSIIDVCIEALILICLPQWVIHFIQKWANKLDLVSVVQRLDSVIQQGPVVQSWIKLILG